VGNLDFSLLKIIDTIHLISALSFLHVVMIILVSIYTDKQCRKSWGCNQIFPGVTLGKFFGQKWLDLGKEWIGQEWLD